MDLHPLESVQPVPNEDAEHGRHRKPRVRGDAEPLPLVLPGQPHDTPLQPHQHPVPRTVRDRRPSMQPQLALRLEARPPTVRGHARHPHLVRDMCDRTAPLDPSHEREAALDVLPRRGELQGGSNSIRCASMAPLIPMAAAECPRISRTKFGWKPTVEGVEWTLRAKIPKSLDPTCAFAEYFLGLVSSTCRHLLAQRSFAELFRRGCTRRGRLSSQTSPG